MIAQYRPEIARLAEQTVVNLKECESQLELLRNDLVALCATVGHPAAAQVAATPARLLPPGIGTLGGIGISPVHQLSPYGNLAPWATGVGPFATPFAAPFPTPFPAPFGGPQSAVPAFGPAFHAPFPSLGSFGPIGGAGAFGPGFAGITPPAFP